VKSWLISLTRPPSLPPSQCPNLHVREGDCKSVRGPNIFFFFFQWAWYKPLCAYHKWPTRVLLIYIWNPSLFVVYKAVRSWNLWVAEVGFTIGHYDATRHPGIATVEIGLIASGHDTDRTPIASRHMDRLLLSTPKPTMHWNCFRWTAAYYNNLESLWHIPENDWRDDASVRRATTWQVRSVKTRATTRAPKHTTGAMQT
jgi:hypothetical protein